MTPRYNPHIHGFRGFAAFSVLVFHIFSAKVLPHFDFVAPWYLWNAAAGSLKYGVELFFMISGYVILGSLRRHASIGSFFKDRLLRIYPAFLPVHILVFITGPFVAWAAFQNITVQRYFVILLENTFFLPTIFPVPLTHWAAWSLSYEWLFYFLSAITLVLLRKSKSPWPVIVGLSALGAVLLNFYPRGLFFIPGVIVFLYEKQLVLYRRLFRFPLAALVVLLCAWSMTGANLANPFSQVVHWMADRRILMAVAAFAAGFYLISAIVMGEGLFSRLLTTRPALFLGTISYSFYLWHPVVVVVAKRIAAHFITPQYGPWPGAVFFIAVSLAVSIPISWLSYSLCEVRLARMLKELTWSESLVLAKA